MEKPTLSGETPGQAAVYRRYVALESMAAKHFSGTLAGCLMLCDGFDRPAGELALATTMAGGVFLGIEADAARLKAAIRNGSCNFMVNTLDEALRVLKNELRKHTPLSTGLLGAVEDVLPAMVERGVQPDLVSTSVSHPAWDVLTGRGARTFVWERAETPMAEEAVWMAANPRDMRRLDATALGLLSAEDGVRRHWLERAAGVFHRERPLRRVIALSPAERERVLQAFRSAADAGEFQAGVEMRWRDERGAEQRVGIARNF